MFRPSNEERPLSTSTEGNHRAIPRRALRPLTEFLQTELAGSSLLLVATAAALIWVNSPWGSTYEGIWHTEATFGVARYEISNDLRHWINEALMAVFFFVVGLELKRELLDGELRDRRRAVLPAAAALGGMIVPAALYAVFNRSGPGAAGWGVPMATDIAFVLGVLALVPRVPSGIKTFLLTLAIVDDIGAILVIAFFYSSGLEWGWVVAAGAGVLAIYGLRWLKGQLNESFPTSVWISCNVVLGVGVWLATFNSGVHATIAGVVLALCVRADGSSRSQEGLSYEGEEPPQTDGELSPAERLEHALHPWTSFAIVPLFALANAGVRLDGDALITSLRSRVTWGIVLGLLVGKLIGITVFSIVVERLRLGRLPRGASWPHIVGAAALAGIGFTVSLFIAGLAFGSQPALEAQTKVGVLVASLMAAAVGAVILSISAGRHDREPASPRGS